MSLSIAMVALDKDARISGAGICDAWALRWPKSPQPNQGKKSAGTMAFRAGDHQVIYGLMPAPIPAQGLDELCRHSPFGAEAVEPMKRHSQYVIVTAMGDGDRTALITVLTQATNWRDNYRRRSPWGRLLPRFSSIGPMLDRAFNSHWTVECLAVANDDVGVGAGDAVPLEHG